VEFQGETKVLLAEKYYFVLQQSFHVIWSQICYNIELSLSYLSRCGPLRAGICGVSGKNKGSEKYIFILQ
jgi:hypothetical protein